MGNKIPFFSIVIPTYNQGYLIKRCLDSILSQTYTNWEAIIINNFSEDNTVEIVERYHDSRIRLINNANNGIIAISRNKGIKLAKGEWVCFLDSDDWWTPDKLESCLPFLDNYDLLYHDCYIVRKGGRKIGAKTIMKGRDLLDDRLTDMLVNGNAVINSSVVMRKEIVEHIGLLSEDPAFVAVEDYDYWLKIMDFTPNIKYIDKILGYYWVGANTSASLKQVDRLTVIYNKYKVRLTKENDLDMYCRICYDQARIYHMNGEFYRARKLYRIASKRRIYSQKSFIGLSLAWLHYKY